MIRKIEDFFEQPLTGCDSIESEIIDVLISTGSWGAVLWEPLANLGHIVVVAGMDETGKIIIRDPWDATSYKMDRE